MPEVVESGLGDRVHLTEPHQSGRPRHSEVPLNANDDDRVNQARRQSGLFGESAGPVAGHQKLASEPIEELNEVSNSLDGDRVYLRFGPEEHGPQ